ncbi:MAG: N-acetylmuramoyl-L-alanine amidase [Gammaproteobacteria bacterium]|nr:N-acetylmuramoyl-L-alanine amidase [Gammaproteobacteria bacterium]
MKFKKDYLEGDGIVFKETPNKGGVFGKNLPDTIIIHFTAGSSAESSVNHLCKPSTKASAHLVIGRDESITQLVPFDTVAWHAGPSSYGERKGFNKYSIGIEIDNAGRLTKSGDNYVSWFGKIYHPDEVVEAVHRNESETTYWHRYTEEQISIVQEICTMLTDKYKINSILGHEEISSGRKIDPGPAFPLDTLRERVLMRDRSSDEASNLQVAHKIAEVTANNLNIRSAPVDGVVVAPPLAKGTKVEVLQEKDGWLEVDARIKGWVSGKYIST